jgi:hypothetical protein
MPFDLIHTHKPNAATLTRDEVQQACPAAFTKHASPATSERYGFVSTSNAIDILADHGFAPVRAIQKPVRKLSDLAYADHMLTFAPTGLADSGAPDRAEIVLYNSHNGRSSLKLFAGNFRMICSNGLVAGEGFEAKARHSKLTAQGFSDMVMQQAESLPAMMQRIERMKETTLEHEQAINLAYNAASLRWEHENEVEGMPNGSFAFNRTVNDMLRPNRFEDLRGQDLWTLFNSAQEKLIRGGARVLSHTKATRLRGYPTVRKARAISSLPESIRINRQLWDVAEKVAA